MNNSSRHLVWINSAADFVGGCETYVHEVARALAKRGYRNTLLYDLAQPFSSRFASAFDAVFPLVEPDRQLARLKADAIFVHRLSDESVVESIAKLPAIKLRFLHDHRLFCLREHKYTTLTHTTCTRTTGLGCYACLGCFHRGSGYSPITFRSLSSLQKQQQALRVFDRLLVGSDYFRDHVIQHGFEPERVTRVGLFARPQTDRVTVPQVKGRIAFAGTMVRAKGVSVLLRAAALLKGEWSLVLAGQGRQLTRFQQLAKSLQIAERVEFAGALDGDTLATLMASSQMLAFPSITPETFGLVGIEALAQQIPVIASRVGGIGQWLKHEVNGLLVEPNQVESLRSAMQRLLDSDELRTRLGSAGLQTAAEWTLEQAVDDLETNLDRLFALRIPRCSSPTLSCETIGSELQESLS